MVTFKQNGNIEIMGVKVGVWQQEDMWAQYGRGYKGARFVHYQYHAYLISGLKMTDYTRNELKERIRNKLFGLMSDARRLSEEQKQLNINNATYPQ